MRSLFLSVIILVQISCKEHNSSSLGECPCEDRLLTTLSEIEYQPLFIGEEYFGDTLNFGSYFLMEESDNQNYSIRLDNPEYLENDCEGYKKYIITYSKSDTDDNKYKIIEELLTCQNNLIGNSIKIFGANQLLPLKNFLVSENEQLSFIDEEGMLDLYPDSKINYTYLFEKVELIPDSKSQFIFTLTSAID